MYRNFVCPNSKFIKVYKGYLEKQNRTDNKGFNKWRVWSIFEASSPTQSFPDRSGQAVLVDS